MLFENIIIALIGAIILYTALQGAPPLPSKPAVIETMRRFLEPKPGARIADLGSGDGRIVMTLAEDGAMVDGYEFNPFLAFWSRRKVKKAGLQTHARIFRKNFWSVDLSAYDAVVVFGAPHIMERLAKKLRKELKPGAKICSNAFMLPGWTPILKEHGVFLYQL
ncbi:MAG: class I SAM-dependent methyltransferase [bacterium]|nr:class I SAM-dependent methyltransferase [bacterium]